MIVGSKDFAGAQIISQAYGQTLASKGYKITYKDNIGPSETVYPLLENGDIDLYGEFSGTFLTYLGGAPTSDSAAGVHRGREASSRRRTSSRWVPRPRRTSTRSTC